MKVGWILVVLFLSSACACSWKTSIPPGAGDAPEVAVQSLHRSQQAVSLLGKPLYAPAPAPETVEKYTAAKKAWEAAPDDADLLIWYGRRAAYTGDYREAIRIFSMGIDRFPADARFYRHRGHRWITVREFANAIEDLEKAAALIRSQADVMEPDGIPNPLNTPVSSLHSNIWYHLGLAYYLKNDLVNAKRCFGECQDSLGNSDNLVASTHWLYMILRRRGDTPGATAALDPIDKKMGISENKAYFMLCLFYKGLIALDTLQGDEFSAIMDDAVAYGIGNWYLYTGNREEARKMLASLVAGNGWASFGHIAAEADLAREFEK